MVLSGIVYGDRKSYLSGNVSGKIGNLNFSASNDDINGFEHWFQNNSFLNETDYRLEAQKQRFGVERELSLENYQFHVDVGMDSDLFIMTHQL